LKQKIAVNILTTFDVITVLSAYFCTNSSIISDMFESYSVPLPQATSTFINCKPILLLIGVALLCFLIGYNLYFNKKRIGEKSNLYKKFSIITIILLVVFFVAIYLLFIICVLNPVVKIYEESFLFEANNM
jgi:hypothetical protein